MSIDDFNDEGIKIQELTAPEDRPKKESVGFDPRKEISDEDWNGMLDLLSLYGDPAGHSATAFRDFSSIAADMKIILPERIPDIYQGEVYEQWMKNEMSKELGYTNSTTATMTGVLKEIGIINPQIPREQLINQDQERNLMVKVQQEIDTAAMTGDKAFYLALHSLANLKVFDPQLLNNFENIGKIVDMAKTVCERQLNKFADQVINDDDLSSFLHFAQPLKILAPDKFKELNITDGHWKKLKEYIEREKEESGLYMHITNSARLGVISATKIRFADRSMQLIFDAPKSGFVTQPPVPETRKF